jgi:hypothetical protein
MKTRIIQNGEKPAQAETSGNGAPPRPPRTQNFAARMAHWSAGHRKTAILGWLAFVLVAFMVGNSLGTKEISDLDTYSGEAREAEVALDRAGLRPVEEVVFIQSDKLTVKDPQFRAAVEDVSGRLAQLRNPHCHHTADAIAKARQGPWRAEHLFALRQAVEL